MVVRKKFKCILVLLGFYSIANYLQTQPEKGVLYRALVLFVYFMQ